MTTIKNYLLLPLCALFIFHAQAQSPWTQAYQLPSGSFYGVYALSPQQVIATSEWGRIYQSNDGAQSMQLYQLPGNFSILSDIDFLDGQTGTIGGGCYFPTGDCLENIVVNTTDGGLNWTVEQITEQVGVVLAVNFTPDGGTYIMSDYGGIFHRAPQSATWDSLGRPGGFTSGAYSSMQFFDQNNGFLTHTNYENNNIIIRLLRTTNGGQQWDSILTTTANGGAPRHYFINTIKGFQYDPLGKIGITTDGGISWTTQQVFPTNEGIVTMEFVDENIGYLSTETIIPTNKGRLYRTVDGGNTWTLDFEATNVYFSQLSFSDAENGYALGAYNLIYRRAATVATAAPTVASTIKILPNPAQDFTTIHLPEKHNYSSLAVYNLLGQEITRLAVVQDQLEVSLNTAAYAAGMYLVAPVGRAQEGVRLMVEH